MSQLKKLLILTSGGDAPGMNAAIRAILRTALSHGLEVYSSEGGYQGLIDRNVKPLISHDVANCIQRGGTILKTGRCVAYQDPAIRARCLEYLKELGIDCMVVLGGDGSFRGALWSELEGGPKTIGIPCTIDNDVIGSEYTIGFDTACNTALQAIDKIRDTAFSLNRHFLVEVMGKDAGFLAVDVGIAGGAEFILIPELPLTTAQIVQRIKNRARQKLASIVVVAEADQVGRSFQIAKELEEQGGVSYKVCVLGHIQRGGAPTVKDRKMAALMGYYAVEQLLQGQSRQMVAVQGDKIVLAPFPDPKLGARKFDEKQLLDINRLICEV